MLLIINEEWFFFWFYFLNKMILGYWPVFLFIWILCNITANEELLQLSLKLTHSFLSHSKCKNVEITIDLTSIINYLASIITMKMSVLFSFFIVYYLKSKITRTENIALCHLIFHWTILISLIINQFFSLLIINNLLSGE